jgi:glycerophosphoryl diester phosphodiesterase
MHVWTVNTEGDVQVCLDLGVRAIITDRPKFVLEQLAGRRLGG